MSIKTLLEVATEELIQDNSVLPPIGEVWYDKDGKIICHVCGKSFNKLSSHLVQAHSLTAESYKELYELKKTQKLTSKAMQDYFRERPRTDITKHSHKTRFKKDTPSVRKGTKHRLQTVIERPVEYKKRNKKEKINMGVAYKSCEACVHSKENNENGYKLCYWEDVLKELSLKILDLSIKELYEPNPFIVDCRLFVSKNK